MDYYMVGHFITATLSRAINFSAVLEWWYHLESHQLVGNRSSESETGWMVYLELRVAGIKVKNPSNKKRNLLLKFPECVFGASRWRTSHEDDSLSARVCRKRVCCWHGPLAAFVKGLVFTLGGHLLHCQAHMPFNGMDPTKFRRLFVCFAASVCWDGSASRSSNWCHRSVGLPEPTQCLVSFRGLSVARWTIWELKMMMPWC